LSWRAQAKDIGGGRSRVPADGGEGDSHREEDCQASLHEIYSLSRRQGAHGFAVSSICPRMAVMSRSTNKNMDAISSAPATQ